MRPVTDTERERFDMICSLPTDGPPANPGEQSIALVSTEFDGEETAAIALLQREDDGAFMVYPVALLLTDDMFARLASPDKETA